MDIKSPVGEARNTYTYTADGIKRKTLQQWNSNYSTTPVIRTGINVSSLNLSKTTDYAGNIIYEVFETSKCTKHTKREMFWMGYGLKSICYQVENELILLIWRKKLFMSSSQIIQGL